jgi:outer membrane receptor for ferrienterochelin and colicin
LYKFKTYLIALLFSFPTALLAKESAESAPHYRLEKINVLERTESEQQARLSQTLISTDDARKKRAQSLSQALENQRGIDVQATCANCGAKRILLNGLKGEHSTFLIDGVPSFTSASAFYGMDALPLCGLESIVIYRGTGASLSIPESIGGAVDIRTQTSMGNALSVDTFAGNAGTYSSSWVGTFLNSSRTLGIVGAFHQSGQGVWDQDGNRVAESPSIHSASGMIKMEWTPTSYFQLHQRLSYQYLNILGGTTEGQRPTSFRSGFVTDNHFYRDQLFSNGGDVRTRFFGPVSFISDFIRIRRKEYSPILRWKISKDFELENASATAFQRQESIYLHGYDYDNRDRLLYHRISLRGSVTSDWKFGVGTESKWQRMMTESVKLFQIAKRNRDGFRYFSQSFFLDQSLQLSDQWQWDAALRWDYGRVNWVAPRLSPLKYQFLSPRTVLQYQPNPQFTYKLSYGQGYRPPLSFFESQHGLTEQGFEMEIHQPERSHSFGLEAEFSNSDLSIGSSHFLTLLKNMAYADQDIGIGDPVVFKNVSDTYWITAHDVHFGIRKNLKYGIEFNSELTYEKFRYSYQYGMKLPVAPIEDRVRWVVDIHVLEKHEFTSTLTWIGPRDLTRYRYQNRFRTLAITPDPFGDPNFDEIYGGERKFQRSNPFLTVDLGYSYKILPNLKASLVVQNLLNTTQTGMGDSPLNWNQHGQNRQHFHLDNNAIWGPNRGRVITAGIRWDW